MVISMILRDSARKNRDLIKKLKHELEDLGVEVKKSHGNSELVIKKKEKKNLKKAINRLNIDPMTQMLMMDIVEIDKKIYVRKRIA